MVVLVGVMVLVVMVVVGGVQVVAIGEAMVVMMAW